MSAGWQVWSVDGEHHIVPVGEEHERDEACWCLPTLEEASVGTIAVWVHHSGDRREYTVERQ